MANELSSVHRLKDMDDRSWLLQCELMAVINLEKFGEMKTSTVVGVLEFLKWNLISQS